MKILRAYKTEIDVNNRQKTLLSQHIGCARWAFNWGLNIKKEAFELKEKCRAIGSVSSNIIGEFLDSKKEDSNSNNWIDRELDGIFIYG